ncbi:MAG: PEP-CTERM sorting domain-containing protein [Gemmatimonas sp.]
MKLRRLARAAAAAIRYAQLSALLPISVAALATEVHAQWAPGPGGDYEVTLSYKTSATFSCFRVHYHAQPCTSDAAGLTLWNGDAFARFTFAGVEASATHTNVRKPGAPIGMVKVTFGGTGLYTWPQLLTPGQASFTMQMALEQTGVANPGKSWSTAWFTVLSPTRLGSSLSSDWFIIDPDFPHPHSPNPGVAVFDRLQAPQFTTGQDASFEMTAWVGVIPEPSTYALLGMGLVAIAAVRRRRVQK